MLAAAPGDAILALLTTLDGLYGLIYGLLAACTEAPTLARALDIIEALPQHCAGAATGLPLREAQTLAMELLFQRALETGLEATVMDNVAYRRYSAQRASEGGGG